MHVIHATLRDEAYQALLDEYVRRLVAQKRHFITIWMLITRRTDIPRLKYWISIYRLKDWKWQVSPEGIETIPKLLAYLHAEGSDVLMDDLTFGPVASFSDFLISEAGCGVFLRIFAGIVGPQAFRQKVRVSRVCFFSPRFLRFLQVVLRPIVWKGGPERLACRWTRYAGLCPSYAIRMLRLAGVDAAALFARGCLDVIMERPLWTFGLCEPFESPPARRIAEFRGLFEKGDRPLLPRLLQLLCERGGDIADDQLLMSETDALPEFRRVLLSSVDICVLQALGAGSASMVLPDTLTLWYGLPAMEEEGPSELLEEATMRGGYGMPQLRHLLQRCDIFAEGAMEGVDFNGLLSEVLVERGRHEDRLERVAIFEELAVVPRAVTVASVGSWLRGIVLERTRDIEVISKLARINFRSREIEAMSLLATLPVELSFFALEFEGVWRARSQRGFFRQGQPKPTALRRDFAEALGALRTELPLACEVVELGSRIMQVIFSRLTSSLSFADFLESRADLVRLDEQLHRTIAARDGSAWLSAVLGAPEQAFHRSLLSKYVCEEDVGRRIRRAFAAPSLLKKIVLGNRVRGELRGYVESAAGMREFGADDWQPLEVALWVVGGARQLLANYVFLQSYFCAQATYHDFFHDSSVSLVASIAGAIHAVSGSRPEDLVPAKDVALWTRPSA